MNKAVDVGYKIIIFGGHQNELRNQTQSSWMMVLWARSFKKFSQTIGSGEEKVGVGLEPSRIRIIISLTSTEGDFSKKLRINLTLL